MAPNDESRTAETAAEQPSMGSGFGRPGDVIGPYKLREQLGEGGMGTVFVADQTEPVKRRVAIKFIRSGMTGSLLLARFDQERQALAMMDHPNIAKVFDAGSTPQSGPYFVMELVKGIPITRYCDDEKLSPRERLELFIPVCQAVQHAHQKGIIHRDLKPSNVLVALYDGRPVPKVIDFGVAKAIGPKLTEQSMYTEVSSIIGTLEYMAPEQAELNNLDIDTRADIYSLGVILYELLAGSTPFSRKQLQGAAFDVMLRLIREVEPPKPSTKLSSSAELPTLAAARKLEPKRLTSLVRGELDWIVMKCLEKERSRRYETANALANDIGRFLRDESVLAGPPSTRYRIGKFIRRNKGAVAMGALSLIAIFAVSIGLVLASLWRQEETAHKQEEVARKATEAALRRAEIAEANERGARELLAIEQLAALNGFIGSHDASRAASSSDLAKRVVNHLLDPALTVGERIAPRLDDESRALLGRLFAAKGRLMVSNSNEWGDARTTLLAARQAFDQAQEYDAKSPARAEYMVEAILALDNLPGATGRGEKPTTDQMKSVAKAAREIDPESYLPDYLDARAAHRTGNAFELLRRYREANEWHQRAIDLYETTYEKTEKSKHPNRDLHQAGMLISVASLHKVLATKTSDPTRRAAHETAGEQYFEKANIHGLEKTVKLQIAALGAKHPATANTMYSLARRNAILIENSKDKNKQTTIAMDWLSQAIRAGYRDERELKIDVAFNPLREREDFKKLLAIVEAQKTSETQPGN